jgi:hypothetical protein
MAGKSIPLTFATLGAALAFAIPAGAQGSKIPECSEPGVSCPPAGSTSTGRVSGQGARLKFQPTVNTDGTWRVGNRIAY